MPRGTHDPKGTGCTPCALDTASCNVTSDLPAEGNALRGSTYTGFSKSCGGHTYQQINFWTGGKFAIKDYISLLWINGSSNTMPLFRQLYEKYPAITRLLFDWEEVVDPRNWDGKPMTILSFKSLPNNPEMLESPDGQAFVYTQFRYERPRAFVIRDETSSNQILVGKDDSNPIDMSGCDALYQDMFKVGDVVLIHANGGDTEDPDCCSRMVQRAVIDIDEEVFDGKTFTRLTLEDQPTSNSDLPNDSYKGRNGYAGNSNNTALNKPWYIYPGDEVQRLYRTRNDHDKITGRVNDIPDEVKFTHIQHFFNQISFTKAELNTSYAIEEKAIGYIKRKVNNINRIFIDEIASSFYFWQNRGGDSAVTYTLNGETRRIGSETMGVIPSLYEAHANNPLKGIIQDVSRLRNDDDYVRAFLDQLLAVQEAGVLSQGEKIAVLMDQTAYNSFHKLNAAWNRLMGTLVTSSTNITKDFQIPTITTSFGTMEFLYCQKFSDLMKNSGNILFIPTKMVALVQRENDKYDVQTGTMTKQTMGFKTTDITTPAIHGHEKQIFDIFGERAIALGMVDSGAWRMLQGFRR